MTNEEAIKRLKEVQAEFNENWVDYGGINEAFEKAYQALETGEIYITGEDYNLYMEGYKDAKKDFEPKRGEWVLMYCSCGDRYYTCSICNRAIEVENGQSLKDYPFCHCGADMRKGDTE